MFEWKAWIQEKLPGLVIKERVVLHQNSERLHLFLGTRIGRKTPTAYSADIAPSDLHLFSSLQNNHNGNNFNFFDDR